MDFRQWNATLIRSLIEPNMGALERDALINFAHLNCLRVDGRFANQVGPLKAVLDEQRASLVSLDDDYEPHPNAMAIAQSGRDWLSSCMDDSVRCRILSRRVALDPIADHGLPLTLHMRLQDNDILDVDYFKLISDFSSSRSEGGNLGVTQSLWELPAFDAIEAVKIVLLPEQQQALGALISEGRLRLVESINLGNLCIMTACGAFVQLAIRSNLVEVLSFAHEIGHALDFEQRWRRGDYRPVEIVQSEAIAMEMEFRFDEYLAHRQHFYGPWHVALHRFELGLYDIPEITPPRLDQLWRSFTSNFGVEQGGWRKIQHYYTSPFYLMCYPLALANCSLIGLTAQGNRKVTINTKDCYSECTNISQ